MTTFRGLHCITYSYLFVDGMEVILSQIADCEVKRRCTEVMMLDIADSEAEDGGKWRW